MVQKNLRMELFFKSVTVHMELLFMNCKSLMRQNGMVWVTKSNQKVEVCHALSVIKQAQLRSRLEQDINLAMRDFKDDFAKFVAHAIGLSVAFGKLYNRNRRSRQFDSAGGSNKTGSKIEPDPNSASKPIKNSGMKPPPSPCSLKA